VGEGPRAAATVPTAHRPGLGDRLPWRALERQLIENWTGLLGVLVLVAGITFLVVNIALRLGPVARFLLTLAAAAALIAPSLGWSQHPRWRSLVAWLRSGGVELMLNTAYDAGERPASPESARVRAHADTLLYISCDDADAFAEAVTARGLEVLEVRTAPHGTREAHLRDPDGYALCFQSRVAA
jgi:uncharacterized glyoxalase superfamily protein PhnB